MKKIIITCIFISISILFLFGLCLGSMHTLWNINHTNTSRYTTTIVVAEPNFTDTVVQSVKSVVHIKCPQWQGSGFVIGPNLIVTARHCVEGVESFTITTHEGYLLHAYRAISSKKYDVAFIYVDDLSCLGFSDNSVQYKLPPKEVKLIPLKLGSIKNCKLGQDIFIIGSPFGNINFNSVSKGIISGINKDWDTIDPWTGERYGWEVSFTSDSAAHPGNSGGAVFTMDGVVRGVLVGGYSPVLNCSMPCDLFLPDIEQIKLMFIMDKYQFEKVPEYSPDDYYNHAEDNEYY